MLANLRPRDEQLGEGDVVVGQKEELDVVPGIGIIVDGGTDIIGEGDHALGDIVGAGRFASDNNDAGLDLLFLLWGHLLELLVLENDGENIEVLSLVLVDSFDLDIQEGVAVVYDLT